MANNCFYQMKIAGTKKNCQKWLDRMNDYEEDNHFWRIFNAEIINESGDDDDYEMEISGDCAWSLESCCRASGYSDGVDLFRVNTQDLDITMEAYSKEPGLEFSEHYIYEKGVCIADECVPYREYYWDTDEYPTYEEYKKEYRDAPDEETIIENDYWWSRGGFPEWSYTF